MSGWPLGSWLRQWLLWQQGLLLNFWFVFVVIIEILDTIVNFIIGIVVFTTTIIITVIIFITTNIFSKVSANAAGGGLLASDAFLR